MPLPELVCSLLPCLLGSPNLSGFIFSVWIFSFQTVTFVCLRWVAFSWEGDIISPCGETRGNSTVSVLSSLILSPGVVLPV